MESDARFYRRRANEELAAAGRAVTEAARRRRVQLADAFLERLKASEARAVIAECGAEDLIKFLPPKPAFDWREQAHSA